MTTGGQVQAIIGAVKAKRQVTAFGGMWFGGPHQARQGEVAQTRARNDALIALVSKYPKRHECADLVEEIIAPVVTTALFSTR